MESRVAFEKLSARYARSMNGLPKKLPVCGMNESVAIRVVTAKRKFQFRIVFTDSSDS